MTIRRSLVLLASLCACSPLLNSQEVKHAPTVEQCRADQRLWLSKSEGSGGPSDVSYTELDGWHHQMLECYNVDPERNFQYANTMGEIMAMEDIRLERFVRRHNLYDQFLGEDAQGKGR